MCKVYICDLDHKDVKQETEVFSENNIDFKWFHAKTQDEVIRDCNGAVVLLNQYVKMDKVIFEALPTVKCIVRYGVGYDNVNMEDAKEYGVQVCNIPDYGTCEVADQALAHVMTLTRKTYLSNKLIRDGIWDYQNSIPIFRLKDATVGICGVGRIGTAFVERIRPLCGEIIAYDPEYTPENKRFPDYITYVSFNELLDRSDIISVHSPLCRETYHMFNEDALSKMKPTAFLVNAARGGIIDENALYSALKNNRLAGAGLDVVENEPMTKDNPLLVLDNFSISPHSAWYSVQSSKDLKRKAAEEAVRFLKGEELKYPLIKEI